MEFKTLIVYQKAKEMCRLTNEKILSTIKDRTLKDQLWRASISVILNIAEGTSRPTKPDQRHFFVIARGSAYECYAILDILSNESTFDLKTIQNLLEEISKMLYALIKKLS